MSTIDFFGQSTVTINGRTQYSKASMHFDVDQKKWECREEQGKEVDGQPKVSAHKSSGTYEYTPDGSRLRLRVENHAPGTRVENQPEDELDPQVGRVVEWDVARMRARGGVPSIFNDIHVDGDIARLEDKQK